MQSWTGSAQTRRLSKQAGFSLVELMVVVAIIGVLATIAIPRVNRFIAKSRQSEAQVNLSSLYTFNKNFFIEFQGYTSSFGAMGFRPEGNLRYNIGFSQASTGPANFTTLKGRTYAVAGATTNSLVDCPTNKSVLRCVTLLGVDGTAPPAQDASALATPFQAFTAQARARLVSGNTCTDNADDWRITENKNLTNNCDGTAD